MPKPLKEFPASATGSHRIIIPLPVKLVRAYNEWSKREQLNRNYLIREAMLRYLESENGPDKQTTP